MIYLISFLICLSVILKYKFNKRQKKDYVTDHWIRDNIYREGVTKK